MQRHTISKSALLHQANVLCCTITKIIEDCSGREPNGLISTWLWFTCQSEADMTGFEADDAWFEQWPDCLLISNLAERAWGFKQIILREGPINHHTFNVCFYHVFNSFCCFPCNQNIILFFFMPKEFRSKQRDCWNFPHRKQSARISRNGILVIVHPWPWFFGHLGMHRPLEDIVIVTTF